MANLKKLKQRAIEQRPTPNDITSYESLKTNFAYSLLINSKYGQEIEGYSIVELSNWIKEKQVYNDFDLIRMAVGVDEDNYIEEVQDGKEV